MDEDLAKLMTNAVSENDPSQRREISDDKEEKDSRFGKVSFVSCATGSSIPSGRTSPQETTGTYPLNHLAL